MYYDEIMKFNKNGLEMIGWDRRVETRFSVKDPIGFLNNHCAIEPGTTLRDILSYVRSRPSFTRFISKSADCPGINQWHKQLDDPPTPDKDIKKLVISWDNENYTAPNDSFNSKPSLYGDYFKDGRKDKICVDGRDLSLFVDIEICLNENFDIYEFKTNQNEMSLSEYIGLRELDIDYHYDYRPTYSMGKKSFTVFEVLTAIYSSIGFYGTPKNAKKVQNSIRERLQEALDHPEDAIPMEEVFERLREKFDDGD